MEAMVMGARYTFTPLMHSILTPMVMTSTVISTSSARKSCSVSGDNSRSSTTISSTLASTSSAAPT